MLQSETLSPHKTKTTKAEPKQSLTRADLKPGLACFDLFSYLKIFSDSDSSKSGKQSYQAAWNTYVVDMKTI